MPLDNPAELSDSIGLEPLFTEFTSAKLRLRNRFAMAPMTREKSPGGVPNAENVEHYRTRAAGGVGLIITEGTYVRGPAAGPSSSVPRFYGADSAEGWRRVVEAVHAEGAAIVPQLWHTGVARGREPEFEPDLASVSPSGIGPSGKAIGSALETADIDAVIAAFAESARLAEQLGFDGVELHGAHGYLLDQFFWERTNRRTDRFGGTRRARTTFPAEVVSAVRSVVSRDFPIVFRYSQWKGADFEALLATSPGELEDLLTPLVDAGVDIFHPSTRRHWLPAFPDAGSDLGLAGWTKKVTGLPAITVGSVGVDSVFRGETIDEGQAQRLRYLTEQFDRGEFDVVALGRALLADPEWVRKVRDHDLRSVVPFR